MRFVTLSSDSSGNGYMLQSTTGEVLLIEAGVKLFQVKKALDFDLTRIAGCIISHAHFDHARYLPDYCLAGIPCYGNEGTKKAFFNGNHELFGFRLLQAKTIREIGGFLIKPFLLEHDVQNFGYLIHNHESGLICFITDTNYCRYTFKGLNNILIEANYSNEIIDQKLLDGTANKFVRDRVLTYHLEFETTKAFLRANDLTKVNNIVLLHLSMDNSNMDQFRREVIELTGKQVFIATQGLEIDLNKEGV
jgi:phosphoribosyl 1,2-cyclic phosphodiesterase